MGCLSILSMEPCRQHSRIHDTLAQEAEEGWSSFFLPSFFSLKTERVSDINTAKKSVTSCSITTTKRVKSAHYIVINAILPQLRTVERVAPNEFATFYFLIQNSFVPCRRMQRKSKSCSGERISTSDISSFLFCCLIWDPVTKPGIISKL